MAACRLGDGSLKGRSLLTRELKGLHPSGRKLLFAEFGGASSS